MRAPHAVLLALPQLLLARTWTSAPDCSIDRQDAAVEVLDFTDDCPRSLGPSLSVAFSLSRNGSVAGNASQASLAFSLVADGDDLRCEAGVEGLECLRQVNGTLMRLLAPGPLAGCYLLSISEGGSVLYRDGVEKDRAAGHVAVHGNRTTLVGLDLVEGLWMWGWAALDWAAAWDSVVGPPAPSPGGAAATGTSSTSSGSSGTGTTTSGWGPTPLVHGGATMTEAHTSIGTTSTPTSSAAQVTNLAGSHSSTTGALILLGSSTSGAAVSTTLGAVNSSSASGNGTMWTTSSSPAGVAGRDRVVSISVVTGTEQNGTETVSGTSSAPGGLGGDFDAAANKSVSGAASRTNSSRLVQDGTESTSLTSRGSLNWTGTLPGPATTQTSTTSLWSSGDASTTSIKGRVSAAIKETLAALGHDMNASGDARLGNLTVLSADALLASPPAVPVKVPGGIEIAISKALLLSLPRGSAVALLSIDRGILAGNGQDLFANVSGQNILAAPAIDLTIVAPDGSRVTQLSEPLLFKLPGGHEDASKAYCAYLDTSGPRPTWSRVGVRRASLGEVAAAGGGQGLWCATVHLSIFSAFLQVVLACTSLDLLSLDGLWALVDNEGWHEAGPSVLTLLVVSLLLLAVAVGVARELWELRLGHTQDDELAEEVQSALGLLKRRYVACLVYIRDLLLCLAQGCGGLRVPALRQGVQSCLAVRTGVSRGCIAGHCWSGGRWIEPTASLPNSVLSRKLEFHAGYVESVVEWDLAGRSGQQLLRRFLLTLLAVHPLLDSLRLGAGGLSVRRRAALQVVALLGALASNALLLGGDLSRGWDAEPGCPGGGIGSQLGVAGATLASVLLNALPHQIILDVAEQSHGRPLWATAFWALLLFYFTVAAFVVALALANLNPHDQVVWHASLRWVLTMKLLLLPTVRALRSWSMLEYFLSELDGRASRVGALLGLRHPAEEGLPEEEEDAAMELAFRAISAQDLVIFTAMLGDRVMPDYAPAKSSSEEVFHEAIQLFCREPTREELSLRVELLEMRGLRPPVAAAHQGPPVTSKDSLTPPAPGSNWGLAVNHYLSCSLLHLGPLLRQERSCIEEFRSSAALAKRGACSWSLFANMGGLEFDHAIGFLVLECGRVLGVATLTLEEVLQENGFNGDVPLLPPGEAADGKAFSGVCTGHVPKGPDSGGSFFSPRAGLSRTAHLVVRVEVPAEFRAALVSRELRKLRRKRPDHPSCTGSQGLHADLLKALEALGSSTEEARLPYCDPEPYPAPDRIVVHHRGGNFLDLVAALLCDALGDCNAADFECLRERLFMGDFHGLLDMLQERGKLGVRYWLDIFAMDYRSDKGWHREVLATMPSLVRSMKAACCKRMAAELRSKLPPEELRVPTQLLVLDAECQLLQAPNCVAEVMLGRAMGLRQEVHLQPRHLQSKRLGGALSSTALGLDSRRQPWTAPFLEPKQAVHAALQELLLQALSQRNSEEETTASSVGFNDVFAALAGMAAGRTG